MNVMREGRSYLELRGKISGELNRPGSPTLGPNSGVIQCIVMPKTPEGQCWNRCVSLVTRR